MNGGLLPPTLPYIEKKGHDVCFSDRIVYLCKVIVGRERSSEPRKTGNQPDNRTMRNK
ncbi:UNVERIFIED_CONTAM: hypothetical protein NY100_00825 [Prevotella sp. 15_C9]